MKHTYNLFAITILFFTISCGNDDETPKETLTFTSNTEEVTAEAGQVIFTANLDLATISATPNDDWITITKGATAITADYEENPDTTPRSGTITISGNDISNITLTINQEAGVEKSVLYAIKPFAEQYSENKNELISINREDGSITSLIILDIEEDRYIKNWISDVSKNVAYGTTSEFLYVLNLDDNNLTTISLSESVGLDNKITLDNSGNILCLTDEAIDTASDLVSIDISNGDVAMILTLNVDNLSAYSVDNIISDNNQELLYVFWAYPEFSPFIAHNFITTIDLTNATLSNQEITSFSSYWEGFTYRSVNYAQSDDGKIYVINDTDFSTSYFIHEIDFSDGSTSELGSINESVIGLFNHSGNLIYDASPNQLITTRIGGGSLETLLILYNIDSGDFSLVNIPDFTPSSNGYSLFLGK